MVGPNPRLFGLEIAINRPFGPLFCLNVLQNRGNTILMGVSLACKEGLVVWLDLNVGVTTTTMGSMLPEVSRCHRTVSRGAFALLLCHPHPALRLRRLLSRPYGVAQPLEFSCESSVRSHRKWTPKDFAPIIILAPRSASKGRFHPIFATTVAERSCFLQGDRVRGAPRLLAGLEISASQ